MKQRYNNYDLLRCLCIIGVFWQHSYYTTNEGIPYKIAISIARTAVPLFIMMSGALVLKEKPVAWKDWLKKILTKIVIPWMLGIILYVGLNFCFQIVYYIKDGVKINWFADIENLCESCVPVRGGHLWYMYTFFILYLLTPLLKYIRSKLYGLYVIIGIFFYFVAIIDLFNVTPHFKFINYISFFIIGDIIFTYKEFCKRLFYVNLAGGGGALLLSINDFGENLVDMRFVMAIWIFLIFTCIDIKFSLYPVSKYIFCAYIIHVAIGEIISGIFNVLIQKYYLENPFIDTLIRIGVTFGVSYLLVWVKEKLGERWKKTKVEKLRG